MLITSHKRGGTETVICSEQRCGRLKKKKKKNRKKCYFLKKEANEEKSEISSYRSRESISAIYELLTFLYFNLLMEHSL